MVRPSFFERDMMIDGGGSAMEISTIGIDIGKSSFHVVGFDARGTIVHAPPVLTDTTNSRARHHSSVRCRDGGLLPRASSRTHAGRARPQTFG
jgi:hypothetical protein